MTPFNKNASPLLLIALFILTTTFSTNAAEPAKNEISYGVGIHEILA